MELSLNLTQVFVQLGIYLLLILVLKNLYFEPILALLKKRESLTIGKSTEANDLKGQAVALRTQYEARMIALREQLDHERHEAVRLAKERTDKKIEEAKNGASLKLLSHQKEILAEGQKLRSKLPELSMEVSKEIVGAITQSRVVRA